MAPAPLLLVKPASDLSTVVAVSAQDRTINPHLERFMAKRMGAETIEVNARHLSLISNRTRSPI
jgi:hypothetical protein